MEKTRRNVTAVNHFFIVTKNSVKKILFKCFVLLVFLYPVHVLGVIKVDGTTEQQNKIARWLTKSLGATVSVGTNGTLTIASGGNASATRLRNMINDASTTITLKIVVDTATVHMGGWLSSDPANPKGRTTGTQLIDIHDLESLGNIINSYGLTPDSYLMHEITEVYEGKKHNLNYEDAHAKGIAAEVEEMAQHGCSFSGRRSTWKNDSLYKKIRRPDGSFVVVRIKPYERGEKWNWFRERVPCHTDSGLIAIPDPDPQVHIMNYNRDLEHRVVTTWDTANSSPQDVAFDAEGNLWVIENLEGIGEIRIFNAEGEQINNITGEELIAPEGIDIDPRTGDVFVAVKERVIRYSPEGELLGSYFTEIEPFQPTDVAVFRNTPIEGIYGDGTVYDIYVTDRNSGQVYRFDVTEHMNTGNYKQAFGRDLLQAPEGLTIDSWWSVWVVSTGNHRVYRFAPNGELEPFGSRKFFIEDTTRTFYDVAMADFDGLYVIDGTKGKGALRLYDFNGNFISSYGEGNFQCPTSVAINFFIDGANLESIPDPGGVEEESKKLPLLAIIGIVFLLAIIIYFFTKRKK